MFKWKNKTLDGFEKDKIQRNILPYSILVVALFAMTFFGVCTPNQGPTGPKGPAAYLGSEVISARDFARAYEAQSQRLRNQYGADFDRSKLKIAQNTIDQLVQNRLDYLFALDLGIVSSPREVSKFLAEAEIFRTEDGKFNEEVFKNYLRNNRYTESSFFEEWERNLTVGKLRDIVTASTFVSSDAVEFEYLLNETKMDVSYLEFDPAEIKVVVESKEVEDFLADEKNAERIKAYYDSNTNEFNKPARVKARHILVSFKGARNASGEAENRSKEDAEKKAQEILTEVKKAGANFSDLAKKYTDEPSGKNSGGDLGFFTKEMMVSEFSDAAFALEEGKISGLVESPFGFHIIKVEKKEKAVSKALETVQKSIAENLVRTDKAPKFLDELSAEILKEVQEKKDISSKLKSHSLEWKDTGEFSVGRGFIPVLGSSEEVRKLVFENAKVGSIVPEVLTNSGKRYIAKIKSLSKGDTKSLDEEKKKNLTSQNEMSQGYLFYSALTQNNRSSFEKSGSIQRNATYLRLDDVATN